MAIILEAAYSKKLGLPNFSSHSYVVSIRTELADISQIPEESSRLYNMLQEAVDREIQEVGFIPDATRYGFTEAVRSGHALPTNGHRSNGGGNDHGNGNGVTNGNGHSRNGNGHTNGNTRPNREDTGISEKQLDLISDIIKKNNANKSEIEQMSVDMFGGGIRTLNRMQASNLIDALFERYPRNSNVRGNGVGA